MKAVVYDDKQGLILREVPKPDIKPDQVLVKTVNTGFCGSDHSLVESGSLSDGFILGHETSGVIESAGAEVKDVTIGDRVIIRPTFCGMCRDCRNDRPYFCQNNRRSIGIGDLPGAFAEYFAVYPQMLIPVPDEVDYQNAALAEAFAASYHGLRCACRRKCSALVIGGGTIGLALVRLLKLNGFFPIALSEPVPFKREIGLNFGADVVVDPNRGSLAADLMSVTGGNGFEAVFECSGAPPMVQAAVDQTARGGVAVVVSVILRPVNLNPISLNLKEVWLTGSYSNTHEENRQILDWMAKGLIDGRPLITDSIALDDLPRIYNERIKTGQALKVMIELQQ